MLSGEQEQVLTPKRVTADSDEVSSSQAFDLPAQYADKFISLHRERVFKHRIICDSFVCVVLLSSACSRSTKTRKRWTVCCWSTPKHKFTRETTTVPSVCLRIHFWVHHRNHIGRVGSAGSCTGMSLDRRFPLAMSVTWGKPGRCHQWVCSFTFEWVYNVVSSIRGFGSEMYGIKYGICDSATRKHWSLCV